MLIFTLRVTKTSIGFAIIVMLVTFNKLDSINTGKEDGVKEKGMDKEKEERYFYVFDQYDGDTFIYDSKEDSRIDDLSRCADILNKYEAKLAESKSKIRVAFRQLASFQLQYDDLKKEYKEQEDLLEKTLATNSRLQFENDQLKQQLAEMSLMSVSSDKYHKDIVEAQKKVCDAVYKLTRELMSFGYDTVKIKDVEAVIEQFDRGE